jgi:O-antigen/teichoic acid export membrane protein
MLRLSQGILGSLACWLMLWNGAGLWAVVMIPLFGVLVTGTWLKLRFPELLLIAFDQGKEMVRHATHNSLTWSTEVWPLQWRFGMNWFASYMLTQIYTPMLFYLSGSVTAGQMGVSFAIANMLAVISNAWTSRHVAVMAQLVLDRDWLSLDRLFKKDLLYSSTFYVCSALLLCLAHHLLEPTKYGQRVLAFWPFAGLLMIGLITHLTGSLAAQLRAFQKEPLVWVMLMGAGFIVPLALYAASHYAAAGVIAVILLVQVGFVLPVSVLVWWRSQLELKAGV